MNPAAKPPPERQGPALRRILSAATDRRGLSAPVTVATLVAYIALALLAANGQTVARGLFDAAVGVALQWLLLWAAHTVLLHRSWITRHVYLRTLLVTALVLIAGITSPAEGPQRVVAFLIITALWTQLDDYRNGLAGQRAVQVQLQRERSLGIERVQEQRLDVVRRIEEMLQTGLFALQDGRDTSSALKELARQQIRPLSHELAQALPAYRPERPAVAKPSPWRQVLERIVAKPLTRPVLMAAAVTVLFIQQTGELVGSGTHADPDISRLQEQSGLVVSVDLGSLLSSFAFLALVFVATWATAHATNRLARTTLLTSTLAMRIAWTIFTPFVLALVVQVAVQLLWVIPGRAVELSNDLGQRLLLVLPIFIIASLLLLLRLIAELFNAAQRDRALLNAELAWEIARANETLAQERRFLSTALHGPLQSTISAIAMSLDSPAVSDQSMDERWAAARERLAGLVRDLADGPPQRRDFASECNEIISTWAGVCDVHIDVAPAAAEQLALDWVSAGTASDLLVEAVSNAVVHGQATRVDVAVSTAGAATLEIVVTDNGQGAAPEVGASTGLGSAQLDEVALSWERTFSESGTTLHVVLPTAPLATTR